MDQAEIKLRAEIGMLRYILEVVLANELARQPEESTEQFKLGLLQASPTVGRDAAPIGDGTLARIAAAQTIALKKFLERLDAREAGIRAGRASAAAPRRGS